MIYYCILEIIMELWQRRGEDKDISPTWSILSHIHISTVNSWSTSIDISTRDLQLHIHSILGRQPSIFLWVTFRFISVQFLARQASSCKLLINVDHGYHQSATDVQLRTRSILGSTTSDKLRVLTTRRLCGVVHSSLRCVSVLIIFCLIFVLVWLFGLPLLFIEK